MLDNHIISFYDKADLLQGHPDIVTSDVCPNSSSYIQKATNRLKLSAKNNAQ